ncbi:MAG: FecR domain-containing protein [Chloroflexota bacterium]
MGVVARICVCIGVGGALVLSLFLTSSSASAQSALLDALSMRVTLAHPSGAASEVETAQIIRSGDTIATDQTGRAVVTYPDGSTALLEENSSLTIEFVQTSAGDYVVRMQQTLGRVWYAVTRAVTLGSRYEVHSAGMASVIRAGSDSYVSVSPSGETTVVTISGTVDTTAGGVDISVPAGSSTVVSAPGATPSANTPAPSTPTPTLTVAAAPTRTPAPSPTSGFVPPVATLPPLPTSAPAKSKTPSPTLPVVTPKPIPAPTPAPTPLKDKFGPRKDALGQPPPKINSL